MEPVILDSSKFLSTINSSAQSKIALYEQAVKTLGTKIGANWQLAALLNDRLVIENAETGQYYQANHAKVRGGRISITNVTPIKIVESKKSSTYEQACTDLVSAIEENDQRGMKTAWNSLAAHRFSPHTIPGDGVVRTRDGVVRRVVVEGSKPDDSFKQKLVKALVESVTDTVVLEGDTVVRAIVGDTKRSLPISEWTCRKMVAGRMRDVAQKAYLSPGFQQQVHHWAYLIDRDQIDEAAKKAAAFFNEYQEFALLTGREMLTLVENALAAKAVLNQGLCEDTAALMHGACLRACKGDIIKEWRAIAKKAQHPALLENVGALEKAGDFGAAYDSFLDAAFNEAVSPRDQEISAYRAALSLLKDTPQVREDKELRVKIEELLGKLHGNEVDNATVNLVREALAAAKKEVDQIQDLDDYDALPGEDGSIGAEVEDAMEDGGAGMASGVPNIVINAPLISIGDPNAAAAPAGGGLEDLAGAAEEGGDELGLGDEGGDELGGDEFGGGDEDGDDFGGENFGDEEGDDDFDSMLGGEEDEDELDLASVQRNKKAVSEDKDWFKKNILDKKDGKDKKDDSKDSGEEKDDSKDDFDFGGDDDEDCDSCDESYGWNGKLTIEHGVGSDYGMPILESELPDLVATMFSLIEERGLSVSDVDANMDKIAEEVIESCGLVIPKHRMDAAITAVADAFCKRVLQLEDQFKWGTVLRRRGFRRSSLGATEKKRKMSEGREASRDLVCEAHDEENQGCLGTYCGIKFVLDYADPPILTTESGAREVPLPEQLLESALAAFEIGNGDPTPFMEWLDGNIEQFRPISADEERELSEAVAHIMANADGSISVEVDGDVAVDELGAGDGMQPIVDMGADEAVGGEGGMDGMPDFEAGGELGGEEMGGELGGEEMGGEEIGGELGGEAGPDAEGTEVPGPEDGEEEELPVKEDKDVTDPTKKGYDTSKQDPRSQPKDAGKAVKGDPGSSLDGFDKGTVDAPKAPTDLKKVKPGANTIK